MYIHVGVLLVRPAVFSGGLAPVSLRLHWGCLRVPSPIKLLSSDLKPWANSHPCHPNVVMPPPCGYVTSMWLCHLHVVMLPPCGYATSMWLCHLHVVMYISVVRSARCHPHCRCIYENTRVDCVTDLEAHGDCADVLSSKLSFELTCSLTALRAWW